MDEDPKNWAPSDPEWHEMYARTMQGIFYQLWELQQHPDTKYAEDLGDWIETLTTLMSFRPRTHPAIEEKVKRALEEARSA